MFREQGGKTVLLGCSIEPELLTDPDIIDDMKRYTCIIARESITWEALQDAGVKGSTYLIPDPAFLLNTVEKPVPEAFKEGNMVGLNLSPMAVENESVAGITMENYRALIRHILDTTDMNIALIPHVVWKNNDDRTVLQSLYRDFSKTGRIVLIEDCSCEELKGYIARCRFFIGARTHSTIAAYSSLVPTLAVGYSVKARGIAKDLFGTWEDYVLPVQSLSQKGELIEGFEWLKEQEQAVRARLEKVMPAYLERTRQIGKTLGKLAD